MAKLKIRETGRNWWTRRSRRDIYINGKHSGVLTGDELNLEVEAGPCKVTVQNSFPSFRSTTYINVEEKADNHVDFRDTKWFLNFLMAVDMIMVLARSLFPMPAFFRKLTNAYAMLWAFCSIFHKDGYFRTFAYSRVAICDTNYS